MELTSEQRGRQLDKVRQWLGVFIAPEQVTELRSLFPNGKCISQFFTGQQLEEMAKAAVAREREGAKGVYYTPNPLKADILTARVAAKDADVLTRKWLLIDVDPKRDGGDCATTAQKEAAWKVMHRCVGSLEAFGFQSWRLVDSGNGYHLYVPVDLPNDTASRDMHKALLKGLQTRCGLPGASVDGTTYNASRIMRVPGTLCRKGASSTERPHRWGQLLSLPQPVEIAA